MIALVWRLNRVVALPAQKEWGKKNKTTHPKCISVQDKSWNFAKCLLKASQISILPLSPRTSSNSWATGCSSHTAQIKEEAEEAATSSSSQDSEHSSQVLGFTKWTSAESQAGSWCKTGEMWSKKRLLLASLPDGFNLQSWRGRELLLHMAFNLQEPREVCFLHLSGCHTSMVVGNKKQNAENERDRAKVHYITQLLVSDIRIQHKADGSENLFLAQNFGFEGQSHRKSNNSASEDELFKYIYTTCHSKMLSSSLGLHTEIILKPTLSWSTCWPQPVYSWFLLGFERYSAQGINKIIFSQH